MAGKDKQAWNRSRMAWARALSGIAREQSQESDMYKMLGNVAWGRYDGEPQPDELKDNVVFGTGFLQGVRYAALQAGERFGVTGTNDLRNIHDRIRREES